MPGDADAGAAAGRALEEDRAATGSTSMFKLEDRKGSPMVLAMTHEECLTYHVAREVRSYRDLPLMLFHIQTKERDEPRPRAGVLRTREFTMKDAYSFDRDEEGLRALLRAADRAPTTRIFDRCGLRWYRVESDVGMMGGSGAHEYMAPCAGGRGRGRAGARLRRQRRGRLGRAAAGRAAGAARRARGGLDARADDGRGGRRLARGARGRADQGAAGRRRGRARLRPGPRPRRPPAQRDQAPQRARGGLPARPARRRSPSGSGRPGFIGPVGADVPVIKDAAIDGDSYVTGANRADDAPARRRARPRLRVRRDRRARGRGRRHGAGGGTIEIEPAIEIGNIFKLGTRYSEPLGATYLDEEGARAADRDGQLRDRAGADRRRGDRAAAPTSSGIVWPPRARPLAGPPRLAGQGRRAGARGRRPPLRGAARAPGPRSSTTTATPGRGRS